MYETICEWRECVLANVVDRKNGACLIRNAITKLIAIIYMGRLFWFARFYGLQKIYTPKTFIELNLNNEHFKQTSTF